MFPVFLLFLTYFFYQICFYIIKLLILRNVSVCTGRLCDISVSVGVGVNHSVFTCR